MNDTIFAQSSGHGRAAIALVRLSGPACRSVATKITNLSLPEPRVAARRNLIDPDTDISIDDAVMLFFAGPASYTGEDMLELHCHGSKAITDYVMRVLSKLGCRPSEPGEFTRRAFENGKMDLTQAEAVHDLIDAETEAQRAQAFQQMGGVLSDLYNNWKDRLARLLAYVEAELDFVDEDLPDNINEKMAPVILDLQQEIRNHLTDNRRGERLRDGIMIAIIGAPNAGKSTLLNALAQRDVAIVSPHAGTTRDVLEVHLDLGGYPVILADTAGLRETEDEIETIGIERAHRRAREADLKLALFDLSAPRDSATEQLIGDQTIIVLTKKDCASRSNAMDGIPISAATGEGVSDLLKFIQNKIADIYYNQSGAPSLTRARHRAALEECTLCLERADQADLLELKAEDIRLAIRAIGKITGKVDIEDLLDIIFRDFCIGK